MRPQYLYLNQKISLLRLLYVVCFVLNHVQNEFSKKKIIINIIVQMCSSRSSNYIFVVEDIIPIKMREIERIYVKNKS